MDRDRLLERIVEGFTLDELAELVAGRFPEIPGGLDGVASPTAALPVRARALVGWFARRRDLARLKAAVDAARPERFDVAISFASEDLAAARRLVVLLRRAGLSVFYDRSYIAELAGADLLDRLRDVYSQARWAVALVSARYAAKPWTQYEMEVIRRTAEREGRDYLLPVRLDETPIPGLPPTISWLDARSGDLAPAARAIVERVAAA